MMALTVSSFVRIQSIKGFRHAFFGDVSMRLNRGGQKLGVHDLVVVVLVLSTQSNASS
jgi:hypothetical protein